MKWLLYGLAMDWFNWHRIGQMTLNWLIGCPLAWSVIKEFISGSAPRSFPFIKGNNRGAGLEMKLYSIDTQLAVNLRWIFMTVNLYSICSQFCIQLQELAFDWQSIRIQLTRNGIQLTVNLHWIETQLTAQWHSIDSQLVFNSKSMGIQFSFNSQAIGSQWLFRWHLIGIPLADEWNSTEAAIEKNPIGGALDGSKFGTCHESGQNRGLSLVESSESRLLIGREHSRKIFKGGTLTILNLCQLMFIEANWQSIGMIFISGSAPRAFPFIKGNDRGAVLEMNPVQ